MKAVRMLARAELRRRWRSVLVLTLLVGVAGAVVLALVAGARRTDSSLQRFQSYSRSSDLEINVGDATPAQIDQFRRSPGVVAVAELHQFAMIDPRGQFLPSAGQVDQRFGTVIDRARVVDGRAADPTKVDELTIGEALAAQLHVGVGDRLRFRSYSPGELLAPDVGNDLDPQGPRVSLRVVGIVRRPLDLGGRGAAGGVIVPTPAFVERYRDRMGSWGGSILRARTQGGAADVPRVAQTAKRIFGRSPTFMLQSLNIEGGGAQNAIDVTTIALLLAAAVAALTALIGIGIALSREIALADTDQSTLSALGMRPRHRVAAVAAVGVPVALGGALIGTVGGLLASSLFPIGVAAKAEPDPGIRVDGLTLIGGFAAILLVVVAIAVLAAVRTARVARPAREPGRPSLTARASSKLGTPPTVTVGTRFALDRGRSRRALPVRSSLFGAGFGIFVVVAVLVFSASLDHLVSTPTAYGWTWDLTTSDSTAAAPRGDCAPITTRLTKEPTLAAVASLCTSSVQVQGRPVTGWGFGQLRGRIEPHMVGGRAPATTDEVVLGADTLAAARRKIGDRVRITGVGGSATYRIVGVTVVPSVADPQALADVAVFTAAGLARVGDASGGFIFVVRVARGSDHAAILQRLRGIGGPNSPPVAAALPAEIDRVRQIDGLPIALALFVVAVALVAVGFALVTTVRRRRHDLAILKTLGFARRQVRATVAWQATAVAGIGLLIGIPLGLIVGRFVWAAVADELGVSSDPTWPVLGVAVLIPVSLLVVNLVAAVPAARAARTRPAVVLRSE